MCFWTQGNRFGKTANKAEKGTGVFSRAFPLQTENLRTYPERKIPRKFLISGDCQHAESPTQKGHGSLLSYLVSLFRMVFRAGRWRHGSCPSFTLYFLSHRSHKTFLFFLCQINRRNISFFCIFHQSSHIQFNLWNLAWHDGAGCPAKALLIFLHLSIHNHTPPPTLVPAFHQ